MHVSLRLVNRLKTVIIIIGVLVLHPNIPKQNDSVTKYIIFFNIMISKPNLNIGFYFIKNGSLTCNVFGHVKLNLKLSLFQNLDLEYSIFPIVVPRSELSISLFCKIPKSKILTKKKLWSRSGEIGGSILREATLLNVQCGKFEVLSNHKTLYSQWRLLGQREDNFQQQRKKKPMDEFQIVPRNERPLPRRDFTLHQLVPSNPMESLSSKSYGIVLGNCMMSTLFVGVLGFGLWAKTKDLLRRWGPPAFGSSKASLRCLSTRSLAHRHPIPESFGLGDTKTANSKHSPPM